MAPKPKGKVAASSAARRCLDEALSEMCRLRSCASKCRGWFDQAPKSTTQPPRRVRLVLSMSFLPLGRPRMFPPTPRQTLSPSPLTAAHRLGLAMTWQETSAKAGQAHHLGIWPKERSIRFLWTEPKVYTCRILPRMSEVFRTSSEGMAHDTGTNGLPLIMPFPRCLVEPRLLPQQLTKCSEGYGAKRSPLV